MLNKEAEEDDFINLFGKQYGYGNKIDQIRKQEFKRLEGMDTLLIIMWLFAGHQIMELIHRNAIAV